MAIKDNNDNREENKSRSGTLKLRNNFPDGTSEKSNPEHNVNNNSQNSSQRAHENRNNTFHNNSGNVSTGSTQRNGHYGDHRNNEQVGQYNRNGPGQYNRNGPGQYNRNGPGQYNNRANTAEQNFNDIDRVRKALENKRINTTSSEYSNYKINVDQSVLRKMQEKKEQQKYDAERIKSVEVDEFIKKSRIDLNDTINSADTDADINSIDESPPIDLDIKKELAAGAIAIEPTKSKKFSNFNTTTGNYAALNIDSKKLLSQRSKDESRTNEYVGKQQSANSGFVKSKTKNTKFRANVLSTLNENDDESVAMIAPKNNFFKRRPAKRFDRYASENKFIPQEIFIEEGQTVKDISALMNVKTFDLIRQLNKIDKNIKYKDNSPVDVSAAELVTVEMGHIPILKSCKTIFNFIAARLKDLKHLVKRPPVVTIMGHVDHGKTSLLDALRLSNVVAGESGGITQHIGAYQITTENGEKISMLDTPGHEAFTAIRARGASVTDIVILVVAADDGIKPQTIEAIRHTQAAGVPMIVAINKIDKTNGGLGKVEEQLIQYDIITESNGGEVMMVPISAKNKTNLDKLVEAILIQAEMMELQADPTVLATGVIIESKINNVKGCSATILVQNGTLHQGDSLITNDKFCKVRAMYDEHGGLVKEAGPSVAVEMFGFEKTPDVGQKFIAYKTERDAKDALDELIESSQKQKMINEKVASLAKEGSSSKMINIFDLLKGNKGVEAIKELNFIIKADVNGTIEAIKYSLEKLNSDNIKIKIICSGTGAVNESDVMLARSSDAMICAFNVAVSGAIKSLLDKESVRVRSYSIIYKLIEDVEDIIANKLKPQKVEEYIGKLIVKQIFTIGGLGKVLGSEVRDGIIRKGALIRIKRKDKIIAESITIKELRRLKDSVSEVKSGLECGVALDKFDDVLKDDILEVYNIIENK